MFAKRYSPDELIDIIAAPSYSPEIISCVKKVANEPFLSQFLSQKPKLGITGTIAKDYVEADTKDAVPYVSTKQVKGLHAYIDDAKYISKEADIEWAKCRVEDGDIIINKSGNVGAAAVLCSAPYAYANSVSDIINIKLAKNAAIDRDYLVVYLNSPYGQKQLQRLSGGAIFSHVSLHAIPDVRVFHPDIKAQKYIGGKVRQAEQLRAWAKRLRASVDDKLNSLNLPINEPPQLLNRVSVQTMEDRLDPRPYRSHYLHLVNEIEKLPHDSINSLVGLASGCPVSSKDFLDNAGIPLVRIRNIGFDDFVGLDTGVSKDVYQDASKYQAKEKMIVVGMDGIFRSQFFVADELPMLVNQRVAMLVPQKIRGELLTHWLNRPEGQMQLNQWAVKTTVEHTSLSDIGRVLVPRLEESLESKLADDLLNARLAYRYAKFLTQAAKTLVEALIEGQLTEQQLIQAHQALGDGDNSLDQAILSKLSDEGYAVEGAKPLFSDIDELYRLLESAAEAEE